jgi:hypothetical protein
VEWFPAVRDFYFSTAPCASKTSGNGGFMEADPEVRQLLQAIREHINSLPQGERLNGLLKFVAVMLNYLSREQVLTIRAEMVAAFGEQELAEALNLLDGHLALRDIEGEKD